MATKLWAYKQASEGAKAIAEALGIKRLLPPERSRWQPKMGDKILNWGNGSGFERFNNPVDVINHPNAVGVWTNKRTALEATAHNVAGFGVPHTTDIHEARRWQQDGISVVVRNKLQGHSGEGIEIINDRETEIPQAPLYTMYIKKKQEYRIHFVKKPNGDVSFLWQQKKRNMEVEEPNWQVRNLEGGFIYAVNDITLPELGAMREVERKVVDATEGLVFGAADIIYSNNANQAEHTHKYYLLEVNTACGVQSPTVLEFYKDNLGELL